jgi:CopA family copper-resistance protein
MMTRRDVLRTAASAGALVAAQGLLPAWARSLEGLQTPSGVSGGSQEFDLTVGRTVIQVDGRQSLAVTVNGSVPAPLLRFREGEAVTLRVRNELDEPTSIHWHGILLPFEMDGVPGVTFPGIPPGETFVYRYPVTQSGTYWYHSHTGLQEQLGHYGPLIVDPVRPDPVTFDREHVIVLGDWMFESPYSVLARLKKQSDYSNYQRRTVGDFFRDVSRDGLAATVDDRLMWGRMRMMANDIADVTGHLYTYLMNGQGPDTGWTGLFSPGERVRLRFVNAAAVSYFNVRIPGLPMTVVQADGQNVEPVTVDEFQVAVAETFDVIVEPLEGRAYTVFAESMDRSGYARGTLAPREGMTADVPALREPPQRTMIDMGMEMDGMTMPPDAGEMTMNNPPGDDDMAAMSGMAGAGPIVARHGADSHGSGNAGVADVQRNRVAERGTGLQGVDHRVLVYTDLRSLEPHIRQPPSRELELHLTGNMERYMWSFDGRKFSEVTGPIPFRHGERLRLTMVNDTMMEHPIHLHGMWMELENGQGEHLPRKHTISVKPAERLSVLITADSPGRWAFHCHFLYHMEMGMFRVVEVSPYEGES